MLTENRAKEIRELIFECMKLNKISDIDAIPIMASIAIVGSLSILKTIMTHAEAQTQVKVQFCNAVDRLTEELMDANHEED